MAPEHLETERLVLRRPRATDVDDIFARYASDPVLTRLMSFPTHTSTAATHTFISMCDEEWNKNGVGAYLICDRTSGSLLGSSGIHLSQPWLAITGYILAKDAQGRGIATEATLAMVKLAKSLGVVRLQADCHVDNARSIAVLDRAGFQFEGTLRASRIFPNLNPTKPQDVRMYSQVLR